MEGIVLTPELLEEEAVKRIERISSLEELETIRNDFLSKKGRLAVLMKRIKDVPNEEKATFGARVNLSKERLLEAYEKKKGALEKESLEKRLKDEEIDITLPSTSYGPGSINPYHLVMDEAKGIFAKMGYMIYEGHDVESDHYNFELLNIPKDHPARDMQDTFYLEDGLLLRTHTSAAQAHAMEEAKGSPIRMISTGKCYRRDDDDMTHSHQFAQIEGLVIDKNISLADLKGTLEMFVKKMFGEKREIRLRSSYFPFTEPSVEVDVSCGSCNGKGCSMCKGTGWIEILGAGMVHPNVLKMGGYDPDVYSGFAFGIGIERVAMLRFGIDYIKRMYLNEPKFLEAFKEK